MDFGIITRKLLADQYASPYDLLDDCQLVGPQGCPGVGLWAGRAGRRMLPPCCCGAAALRMPSAPGTLNVVLALAGVA